MRREPPPGGRSRWIGEIEIAVLGVLIICAGCFVARLVWERLFHG